jgi:ribose transport system ATP-binding protein
VDKGGRQVVDYIIETKNLCKSYGTVQVLKDISLGIRPGEVLALAGENGAGKSTLIKIISGAETRSSGEIRVSGSPVEIRSPKAAERLGISTVYQEFNLVPALSVAENIFLGDAPEKNFLGFVDWGTMFARSTELFSRLGMKSLDPRRSVRELGVAQKQMVEIAKAVHRNARVIIMDEPSATLTGREIQTMFALIADLKARGVSVVYISHRLEEIFELADRVAVLRDGALIDVRSTQEVTRETLIALMVGREVDTTMHRVSSAKEDAVVLSVKDVSAAGFVKDISFDLHGGEILGIFGLVGSGRTELARAIFGADKCESGEVAISGRAVHIRSPQEAIRLGIVLLPEERRTQGVVQNLTVRENITLAALDPLSGALGLVDRARERAAVGEYIDRLRVKTSSPEQRILQLSGGNQQKVVLAKWLLKNAKAFIFDEPTRGIDVGAKREIWSLMDGLAKDGAGILMISSELPEVLAVADRVLVMHEGRMTGELSRAEATQERIMAYAAGN